VIYASPGDLKVTGDSLYQNYWYWVRFVGERGWNHSWINGDKQQHIC